MDEALIEDAKHDVDRDDRTQNEQPLVGDCVLECPGGTVERCRDGLRHAEPGLQAIDLLDAVAERHAVRQIVGDRHRRQLAELIDGEQPGVPFDASESADRHQHAGAGRYLDLSQPLRRPVDARIELHDHLVAVARRVDRRDLLRAEAAIQRRAQDIRGDAQRRRLVAIDDQLRLRRVVLQVGADVREIGPVRRHGFVELLGPLIHQILIQALHDELVLAGRRASADRQVLHGVHEGADARDDAELAAQIGQHLLQWRPLSLGLQLHEQPPGIHRRRAAADGADRAADMRDIRRSGEHVRDLGLQGSHRLEGNVLARQRRHLQLADILEREEAFGNRVELVDRQRHRAEKHRKHHDMEAEAQLERATIAAKHGIEAALQQRRRCRGDCLRRSCARPACATPASASASATRRSTPGSTRSPPRRTR